MNSSSIKHIQSKLKIPGKYNYSFFRPTPKRILLKIDLPTQKLFYCLSLYKKRVTAIEIYEVFRKAFHPTDTPNLETDVSFRYKGSVIRNMRRTLATIFGMVFGFGLALLPAVSTYFYKPPTVGTGLAAYLLYDCVAPGKAHGEMRTVNGIELPKDKYNPRGPEVSEQNFKETLKHEGLVWVMYEYTGAESTEIMKNRGEYFWEVLKKSFGNQVDAFIRINIDEWSNKAEKATVEIARPVTPSFILYDRGEIVQNQSFHVRIRGPPASEDRVQFCLDYIRKYSILK